MFNVAALEAEIEYRQQRFLDEAEQYRRAKQVRAGASVSSPRTRVAGLVAGLAHRAAHPTTRRAA